MKVEAQSKYLLHEHDPKHRKRIKKSTKYLTIANKKAIMVSVRKSQRKDNKMTTSKIKKSTKFNAVLSIAWLVEATFRGFVGWVLLTNFDHWVTTVAAFYALGTAGLIVASHFVRAHK